MGDTEQQGVSPATAGEAPAPDFIAIRDALADTFRGVPLWQLRQGLVAAGLIPADGEIRAVERKPVSGEPGIEAEWDEDVDAMRIDGIGWDLSSGCKVSFAYDHDKGEHYVCVSTSDADQRAGITSRRTTKEQLASLGQQLVNVFGEKDPRDAEIERLRRLVGDENIPYDGWDGQSRQDAIVRVEEAWQEHLKQRDQIEALTAERDRLRAELDLTGETNNGEFLQAEATYWRTKYTELKAATEPLAVQLAKYLSPPEPPVGTRFVRPSGGVWIRKDDGWYCPDGDCENCPADWASEVELYVRDATRYLPGVEVVSSDGQ